VTQQRGVRADPVVAPARRLQAILRSNVGLESLFAPIQPSPEHSDGRQGSGPTPFDYKKSGVTKPDRPPAAKTLSGGQKAG